MQEGKLPAISDYVCYIHKHKIQIPGHNFIHQIRHTRRNVLSILLLILVKNVVYLLCGSHIHVADLRFSF
jgi:hypothetical protein